MVRTDEFEIPHELRASVLVVASLAAALLMAGCSSAAKTPTASGSAATKRTTAAGTVHLLDYSNSDAAQSSVILTGAIGDFGEAMSQHANGAIDLEHTADLNLALTQGSFRIRIAGLDRKVVTAFKRLHFDTSTCSGNVSVAGRSPIVEGSGTGSYKGISGSFTLTVTIAEIVPRSKCNASGAFRAQAIVITGSGIVSFA